MNCAHMIFYVHIACALMPSTVHVCMRMYVFMSMPVEFSSSPPGSLSGLYSKALLQMRSMSSRKSFAVRYWRVSILVMTVERSIGCRITSR